MPKLWLTICLIVVVSIVLTGCEFDAGTALSQLGTHEGETNFDLPEDGKFFTLERVGTAGDLDEYVEVNYDGQVKLDHGKATQKVTEASKDELTKMYELIRDKDYDGLKQELKLDNSGDTDLNETLTLFGEEGREEVFDITAEDLGTGENTILPDSWDVWITKVRRFLGALTGESD